MRFIIDSTRFYILGILSISLYRTISLLIKKRKNHQVTLRKESLMVLFSLYIMVVIGITQFPLYIGQDTFYHPAIRFNMVPVVNTVKDISRELQDPIMRSFYLKFWSKNLLGNLVLLLPFGAILPMIKKKYDNIWKILFASFAISLLIETFQLLSFFIGNNNRFFDVDDILLNVSGALLGYLIYRSSEKVVRK